MRSLGLFIVMGFVCLAAEAKIISASLTSHLKGEKAKKCQLRIDDQNKARFAIISGKAMDGKNYREIIESAELLRLPETLDPLKTTKSVGIPDILELRYEMVEIDSKDRPISGTTVLLELTNELFSVENTSEGADYMHDLVFEFCHPAERGKVMESLTAKEQRIRNEVYRAFVRGPKL